MELAWLGLAWLRPAGAITMTVLSVVTSGRAQVEQKAIIFHRIAMSFEINSTEHTQTLIRNNISIIIH